MRETRPTSTTHPLERIFAILGAVYCLVITVIIWLGISDHQPMWPLPGGYFVEVVALSIISAFTFVWCDVRYRVITWGADGVFSAFSILGAFSVGFLYLPVALIFAVISVTSDVRNKQNILMHLGVCLIAGIAQVALMFAVNRLIL